MQLPIAHILAHLSLAACGAFAGLLEKKHVEDSETGFTPAHNETDPIRGPYSTYYTVRVGNGNPHIEYYNKQVSDTIHGCDQAGASCQASTSNSHTFGYSATGGITPFEWISRGFSVTESYTQGTSRGCSAGPPDHSVCLWYQQSCIAYTVRNVASGRSCGNTGGLYTLRSPMKGNACGKGYYCVVNTCRTIGQGYWYRGPDGTSC